jgi:colicin import membrane protein
LWALLPQGQQPLLAVQQPQPVPMENAWQSYALMNAGTIGGSWSPQTMVSNLYASPAVMYPAYTAPASMTLAGGAAPVNSVEAAKQTAAMLGQLNAAAAEAVPGTPAAPAADARAALLRQQESSSDRGESAADRAAERAAADRARERAAGGDTAPSGRTTSPAAAPAAPANNERAATDKVAGQDGGTKTGASTRDAKESNAESAAAGREASASKEAPSAEGSGPR